MNKKWALLATAVAGIAWAKSSRREAVVDLTDKVVVLTGASSGIGRAGAYAFAQAGANLVLVARRGELLAELADELERQYRVTAVPFTADVTEDETFLSLPGAVLDRFGRIDVLVNNAGLSMGGPFPNQDAAYLHKMINVNVYGPMRLTQVILPTMLRQGEGHIVNVASVAGLVLAPGQTAYGPTRTAVIAFSDALRREVASHGIRVSAVLPGWTRTDMLANMDEAEMRRGGILSRFMSLDEAIVPAEAMVEAVRANRPQITLGGLHFQAAAAAPRLQALVLDWYFRRLVDAPRSIDALRELGS